MLFHLDPMPWNRFSCLRLLSPLTMAMIFIARPSPAPAMYGCGAAAPQVVRCETRASVLQVANSSDSPFTAGLCFPYFPTSFMLGVHRAEGCFGEGNSCSAAETLEDVQLGQAWTSSFQCPHHGCTGSDVSICGVGAPRAEASHEARQGPDSSSHHGA